MNRKRNAILHLKFAFQIVQILEAFVEELFVFIFVLFVFKK